jgi:hypothetical protein
LALTLVARLGVKRKHIQFIFGAKEAFDACSSYLKYKMCDVQLIVEENPAQLVLIAMVLVSLVPAAAIVAMDGPIEDDSGLVVLDRHMADAGVLVQ